MTNTKREMEQLKKEAAALRAELSTSNTELTTSITEVQLQLQNKVDELERKIAGGTPRELPITASTYLHSVSVILNCRSFKGKINKNQSN